MQPKIRLLAPEILLEEYRAILQEDHRVKSLPLIVTGNSMSPFLVGGRDTVYLSRLTRPPRRGDTVLYQRRNGNYVLHRIYKISEDGLTMVGDAQTALEPGIQTEQIIAIVTRVDRKGKTLVPGSFWWDFFEKVWIRIVPVRRILCRTYTAVRKLFGKMLSKTGRK